MATDIVIQLRQLASSIERGNGKSTLYGAANEIERLREQAKQQPYIFQLPRGECDYCDVGYDKPTWALPPHTASPRCQSGQSNHCRCQICF